MLSKKDFEQLSFSELIHVKESVGLKAFNSIYSRNSSDETNQVENVSKANTNEKEKKPKFKRENKNMPQEVTSKKPVSRKRIIQDLPQKEQARDPRFEPLSGKLNEDLFKRSYNFIYNYEENEADMLKQEILKEKIEERKQELKKTLTRLTSRINSRKLKETKDQRKREWKKNEEKMVKDGKKPFFLKSCNLILT
jgi:ribosomal RNA-processing protein 36